MTEETHGVSVETTSSAIVVDEKDRAMMKLVLLLGLPVVFFVATFLFSIPAVLFSGDEGEINILFALGATILAEIVVVIFYLKATGKLMPIPWKQKLGFVGFNWWNIIVSALLGIAFFVALQLVAGGFNAVFGSDTIGSSTTSEDIFDSTGISQVITLFIFAPLVAPILEEIVFRGVLFNGLLLSKLNTACAFIVSAFAFAIVHFQGLSTPTDFFTLGWIFIIALVQCWILYRTRSIYNAMAFHLFYNSSTVFVPMLLGAM